MFNYNLDEWEIVPFDDGKYCARVSVKVTSDVGEMIYDDIFIEKIDNEFLLNMDEGDYKDWPFGTKEFDRVLLSSYIFEQLLMEDIYEELYRQLESGELVLKK